MKIFEKSFGGKEIFYIFVHRNTDGADSPELKTTTKMASLLIYRIEMSGAKYVATVTRKNRKYGESVRVILNDEFGNELYRYISFCSAKDAAIGAICAYKCGERGFRL